jgi:hypothetical protein
MNLQAPAPRRGVILGASNVFRNISTVVATAQSAWGQPLDLLIAAGHGRSYGAWNWVLGYSVPGIVHCGLWEALDARPQAPTAALLTDVGNDLLYGTSAKTILRWVETCLERLQPRCERIVVSELPLTSVARLKPSHYVMLRSVLFPWSRVTFDEVVASAKCLNAGLIELAQKFSASIVQPQQTWYGFDPIHVRRRHTCAAWQTLLGPWCDAADSLAARGSVWRWWQLRMRRTHVQRFLSRERHTPQPALRYADGSTVSLY